MKSFCIKSNNKKINSYILEAFENCNLSNLYISNKHFKIYDNIILHNLTLDNSDFFDTFSTILTNTILKFYENSKLKEIIRLNYFYFSELEQELILENCLEYLNNLDNLETQTRREHIYYSLIHYITLNKSFILDGFINFRLQEYMKILDFVVDTCVNIFLIEKEYNEFINLLKIFINSKPSNTTLIHLLYQNGTSTLFDINKNIISTEEDMFNAKYLSDISFSSNDYALNTLLTKLPEKILIHIIDVEDEFINTLKLIFENRITICKGCSLCSAYKLINK